MSQENVELARAALNAFAELDEGLIDPARMEELFAQDAITTFSRRASKEVPSKQNTPLAYPNMLRRRLRPAVEEAGASWGAYHTFRHTFASLHLARGTNIVQLSRLLGHHSPAFTLERYAHLIPGDEAPPLHLEAELRAAVSSRPRVKAAATDNATDAATALRAG